MGFFDFQHPFLRPLWRRYVLVALCLGWAAVEFITGSPFWGILFGAIGVAAAWQLFFAPWPGDDGPER